MNLAIFDLDNTLIAGDSDHSWGEFLIEHGLVDSDSFKRANDQFYEDYCQGQLDIRAYLRFALQPLSRFSPTELTRLHALFMKEKIEPLKLAKAAQLIEQHKQQGDTLLVITATNRFVTEPIVKSLKIDNLLASDGEIVEGCYTGEPIGTPCFAEGKVTRLNAWLESHPEHKDLSTSVFYSDSHNDLPLLELVGRAVAVDPDETLRAHALSKGWSIISLR